MTVQCDASNTGLCAALTQRGKPIAFASRALTQTEKGYAQIEKKSFLASVSKWYRPFLMNILEFSFVKFGP